MPSATENGRQAALPHTTMPRPSYAWPPTMSVVQRTEQQRQEAKRQFLHSTRVPRTSRHAECVTANDAIVADELRRMEERHRLERQHVMEHGERRQTAVNNEWQNADRSIGGLGNGPTQSYTMAYPLLNQSQISARHCTSKELPIFSGDPQEWSVFISNFEHSTAMCGFSNEENLLRLQRCLKGKARDAVSSCLAHPATVPEAIEILAECYGRPELVVDTLMAKIRRMPAPKEHSFEALVEFGLAVRNLCAAIGASGLHDYFNGGSLLNELVEKLPPNIRLNWFYHRRRHSVNTLEAFNCYMKELTSAACLGVKPQGKDERPHRQHQGEAKGLGESTGRARYATLNVHASNAHNVGKPQADPTERRCPACQEACASLVACKRFAEMDVSARWELVKGKSICRTCLRNHRSPCRVEQRCAKENCGRKHHNLLHDDNYWKQHTASTSTEKKAECHTHSTHSDSTLLKYVPVTLYANNRKVDTMALLDDGSTSTFIEHALFKELGVSGEPRPLCVAWTGEQQRYERNSVELPLQISGRHHDSKIYTMPAVHTLELIKIHPQSVHPDKLARCYPHLKGLPISPYENAEIRLIIGVDNRHLTDALRTVEGGAEEPAAAKTRLGWVVYGPCEKQYATNTDNFQDQHPRAVEAIKYEHYVDDMLSSVNSEAKPITLAEEVRHVLLVAGFETRNWLSNSSKVKKHLNGEAAEIKVLLSSTVLTTEKVLGMWWNTESDTFIFRVNPRLNPQAVSPTKRTILRVLMSIYDPMGLIGNLLMYLKVLIQEIWRSKCTWDGAISGRLREKWSMWVAVLPKVEQISISRCYRRITTSQESTQVTLHIFCDASENGIATVAFLRFEENGEIECALVGSKTRVAPLALVSIPRLELEAAVLGARLARTIGTSHRLRISRKVYWSDSRTVISWLNSGHRRYSQFVAHRVSQIVNTSNASEWNWLSTKLNVADEGTKWSTPPELHPDARRFRGPQFLWEPENKWPINRTTPSDPEEEIRHTLLQHVPTLQIFNVTRFSRWIYLARAAAYVYRFIENAIFRQIQREVYGEEVHQLEKGVPETVHSWKQPLHKGSPLYKLSPVLDKHGVLRMRGRIDRCTWVGDDVKRPIIIPRKHYVATLIIQHYHQRYRHANHDTAMNEIRAKYQISQLRAAYKETKRRCQYCKIYGAMPQPPAMGDLPHQRLAAFQRPFSYTGSITSGQ
ncbi:uncharacterized protein LOC118456469 [Anopheles albimanus]|uniref:uncharacterized protein LOC118456469 n=1 Tax=Anopheles albimanus TaxID=7167 RepID=UPI0016407946|nr:uncharacterized protein LOC118456469 [Anopheles albimanus]